MNVTLRWICLIVLSFGVTPASHAASINGLWEPQELGRNLASIGLFGLVGVLIAILGYKLFDAMTPGDLHKEIIENRNVAAGIVAAGVIIGVAIIVGAAIRQ